MPIDPSDHLNAAGQTKQAKGDSRHYGKARSLLRGARPVLLVLLLALLIPLGLAFFPSVQSP
ncbi:MAG: hypothetical protein H9533_18750 [Rhodobacteraceae bacterium]|nr:hypothetical protein [Paracoccaceae bacterium]